MPKPKISSKVFIIAEAGVNHNGSLDLAYKLIDGAVLAGADAVKFQTFKSTSVISRFAPKAEYQKKSTGADESQLAMVQKLEFPPEYFKKLAKYCRAKGIMFLSTPFDLESIDVLKQMNLKIFKIPSGEITNLPYLRKIGSLKVKVILSTGMSTLKEVQAAVAILLKAGTLKCHITLLHCTTEYPTPYTDVNLSAMRTLENALGIPVGYSDHTLGIEVAVAAVALGARVIEKHFTLDKQMPGPDHKASLSVDELKSMVIAIRHFEQAVGNGIKKPSSSEIKNIAIARKSIVALQPIAKGEILSTKNLTTKRPGNGISPMHWDRIMGQKAKFDFQADEMIRLK